MHYRNLFWPSVEVLVCADTNTGDMQILVIEEEYGDTLESVVMRTTGEPLEEMHGGS